MKKLLFLIFCLLPIIANGQMGYIVNDSSKKVEKRILNCGDIINARYCKLFENGKWVIYKPDEIKEYGMGGMVYVSKRIHTEDTIKAVFLERLQQGRMNFYYYMDSVGVARYYLEKDNDPLIEITKYNQDGVSFRKQLSEVTSECPEFSNALKFVIYKKNALSILFRKYNDCELRPLPKFRYGPVAGYNQVKLLRVPDDEVPYYFDLQYEGGYTIGLFADRPLLASNFSIHPELYYTKLRMSYNSLMKDKDMDLISNMSFLKLPILIRYSISSMKIRPFINLGGILSYTIRDNTYLYKTKITGEVVEIISKKKPLLMNQLVLGYVIGGGIEFQVSNRRSIFLELRHNTFIGSYGNTKISEYNLVAALNL